MNSEVENVPLFVDLDGTLLKTDLLVESGFYLLKTKPWMFFALLYWLCFGKARLKHEIAQRAVIDYAALPYQSTFQIFLQQQAIEGRPIYLATASDRDLAEPVAAQLGFFKEVLASDGIRNLKGDQKLTAIQAVCKGRPFDYAGNAHVDITIWCQARKTIVVNPDQGVLSALSRQGVVAEQIFEDRPPRIKTWLRAMRVHQWAKNVLLGVPILTAHTFKLEAIVEVLAAFLAFGLLASATYMMNDLLDLNADRHHPRKCKRPFAAGNIGLISGVFMLLLLLAASFGLALQLQTDFFITLVIYLIMTVSYSFYFKRIVLVDVLLLAGLYTIRIVAGANAISVTTSSWLLAFSMFIFLSLALVKRCTELRAIEQLGRTAMKGRDYLVEDYQLLSAMGITSGYLSILVMALYIDSPFGRGNYQHPMLLWFLCPLLAYWISRVWLKTSRGKMHDDPLIYSLKDRGSWLIFLMMTGIVLVAI